MLATNLAENRPERSQAAQICEEKHCLESEFLHAVRDVNALQTQQTDAVIHGHPDFDRFDILIQMAQERKDAAKYPYSPTWKAITALRSSE